jgi:hypothetical protein
LNFLPIDANAIQKEREEQTDEYSIIEAIGHPCDAGAICIVRNEIAGTGHRPLYSGSTAASGCTHWRSTVSGD